MNKNQLQAKARRKGVEFEPTDTNAELEAKIADAGHAERISVLESAEQESNVGVITSESVQQTDADVLAVENVPETVEEDSQQEPEPEIDNDAPVLKYVGLAQSYQIGPYKFTKQDPFQVVSQEFKDAVLEHSVDLVASSAKEAQKHYV